MPDIINSDQKAKIRIMTVTLQDKIMELQKDTNEYIKLGKKMTMFLHEKGPQNGWEETMDKSEFDKHYKDVVERFNNLFPKTPIKDAN